jgi:hypothetical protein
MSSIESDEICHYLIQRMRITMHEQESSSQSFIVKIWIEESSDTGTRSTWRGYIVDVLSGKKRYLKNLNAIPNFIAPYLEDMGVKVGIRWRMSRWLNHVRKRSHR